MEADPPTSGASAVIPTVNDILRPLLEALREGNVRRLEEVADSVATAMHVSEDVRRMRLPSGGYSYDNRVGWASTCLHKAGLIELPGPKLVSLTSDGAQLLKRHEGPIDTDFLQRECQPYANWIADMGGELPRDTRSNDESPAVWMVRAGQGGAYAPDFVNHRAVMVGWGEAGDLTGKSLDEISKAVARAMPEIGRVQLGQAANALFRTTQDIREGDVVITPEPPTRTVLFGRVNGAYSYLSNPIVADYAHIRPVRWFARISLDELSYGARNSLGTLLTLTKPRFQEELLRLAELHTEEQSPEPLSQKRGQRGPQPIIESFVLPANASPPPRPTIADFQTVPRLLTQLLDELDNGQLALPDFQRSFVWSPNATQELLVSMIRSFPAGALLLLQGGSETFQARAAEGAPPLSMTPSYLVLDGQQRLTSLYQAMFGVGDSRFFLDIGALLVGADVSEAVRVFPADRASQFESAQMQARALMMPLSLVQDAGKWRDEIVPLRPDDNDSQLRGLLRGVADAYIEPLIRYRFPVTILPQETPLEAVCTIFETLNRTGEPLTPFELISARAFASGRSLRDFWATALESHSILSDFVIEPYYVLQCIALRLGRSSKRSAVLAMTADEIANGWKSVVDDMASVLTMLRDDCGVLVSKWLPYRPMIMPLTVAWSDVSAASGPTVGAMREKLKQWFWCACFTGEYESSSASLSERDAAALTEWLVGGASPPVVRMSWDSSRWQTVTVRQQGLYKATLALTLVGQPRDFHTGARLTKDLIATDKVDDHHIFPRSYLRKLGRSTDPDTVLNHCLIDRATNLQIGSDAPSTYLKMIRTALGPHLDQVLESQAIPAGQSSPLWSDDYDGFLALRQELLEQLLQANTGDWGDASPHLPPQLRVLDEQISTVELALRHLISVRLNNDLRVLPQHVAEKIEQRLAAFIRKNPGSKDVQTLGLRESLDYCDLRDLQDVITSKALWSDFASVFGTKETLGVRFMQMAELRNMLRHNRSVDEVAKKDAEAALVWFRQALSKVANG